MHVTELEDTGDDEPQTGTLQEGSAGTESDIAAPAYAALLQQSQDRCGTVCLAGRSIGAPFVGVAAAACVVAELVRLTLGGGRHEMVSCHLRDLGDQSVISGEPWSAFNPGSIE